MARVLVADDDDSVRSAVMRLLTSAGHHVSGASDAQEAERATIVSLGGDIMQGYHYAKPARGFLAVPAGAWS